MKALKNVFKVLAVILTFGTIALFFFDFASVTIPSLNIASAGLRGIDIAFGGEVSFIENVTYTVAKSGYYLAGFIMAVVSAALAIFGIKKTGASVTSIITSIITAIMLCTYNAGGSAYVDTQGISGVTAVSSTVYAWIAAALIFVGAVFTVLGILAGDKAKVAEEGGKTIVSKVIRFIKDYIGEIKKITWPKVSTATKNTIIVIVISLLIGIFVWALDFGLSTLIDWGLKR